MTALAAFAFRRDRDWRPYGLLSLIFSTMLTTVLLLPNAPDQDGYAIWTGPASMLQLALVGLWQVMVGARSLRLARGQPG